MNKLVPPARLAAMGAVMLALVVVSVVTLYKLQIVEGQAYYEESRNSIVTTARVSAARGSLMDRYGRVLAESRVCNDLVIDTEDLFREDDPDWTEANAAILLLANTVTSFGETYTDTLPVTMSPPFEYTEMTDIQRETLAAYLNERGLAADASAVELMAYMRDRYNIGNSYTAEETRIIAGIRYELNSRYISGFGTSDYVFAEDVSVELIAYLLENNIRGFDVTNSYIRDYNTSYAAHILGYTGTISSEEAEDYLARGYALDAQIGISGAEAAFEDYLHGTDGEARVTRTSGGTVTGTVYTEEPVPGDHVYLTIDIRLQETAENALSTYITTENERRTEDEGEDAQLITGAAAVAVDVRTGEPLAIASWPSYDASTLLSNYAAVAAEENSPLYNRALQAAYTPGSTFKPCVAIAGLAEGKISTGTIITDEGVYTRYEDAGYTPSCWIWSATGTTHGDLTVSGAITHSCNYFFYTLGDYLQISLMAKYAAGFGLGEHTGIELYEEIGKMTSDEYFQEKYGRDVYAGETIQAAIGQAENQFTPLQLAEYCAALANNGTRYSASILKSVYSYDFSEQVYEREAEVLSTVETEAEYYEAVQEGMRGVVGSVEGSAYSTFSGASYTAAGKTGTAEVGEGQTNTGVFICYAPYEEPEIAVAVVIEKGSSGSAVTEIAKEILDYYFSFQSSTMVLEAENQLLK